MKHARHAAIVLLIAGVALAGCSTTYTVGSTSPARKSPGATSPHPGQTRTSPSSTQTSAIPASMAWCSSAPTGQSNTLGGGFDLYNNEWNIPYHPGPQTICGNSGSDWQVTSTQRAGNTAVLTYPSVQRNYNGTKGYPLSTFTRMTSSYAENMHTVGGTDANATYDILLRRTTMHKHGEVMFWVDNHGPPASQKVAGRNKVATTAFSGATWDLFENGKGNMSFVRRGTATSGTVDLLAGLKYLERRGDLAASDVVWQVNFGWEIASTGGGPETFSVSHYSLTSTPSS